jgi:aspartyl-tRNA(Asn)/glutamyl-tRNA(Gln) amidotransferase subunit B
MSTPYILEGRTGPWELVMGLEVHAQVLSQSKLFSGAPVVFGSAPNSSVSFVDAGFPGMLPVLNGFCVEQVIRSGLGLNARINTISYFDRKNYFYADLPTGYQISQYKNPVVSDGWMDVETDDGSEKRIRIERIHLEQDAGKSIHDQHPTKSYVDLNRAGVALMEIVSHPDFSSPTEVSSYVKRLRAVLRALGTCDGNMEEGNLRCDVNVSVRRAGEPLGTRCEIKNVNSIRFISQAIDYEAKRQIEILEDGGVIRQETRLFDSAKGVTRSMRTKEDAHDYRYFPDPDLLPLVIDPAFVEKIRASLPELPEARRHRFITVLKIGPQEALLLAEENAVAGYLEAVLTEGIEAPLAARWVVGELFAALNDSGKDISQSPLSPARLAGLLRLVADGTLSGRMAKEVFAAMLDSDLEAAVIVEQRGLRQVSDTGALETAIASVLASNPDKVSEYKSGKDKLFGFFVGQVMKATGGQANPAVVNALLKKALGD